MITDLSSELMAGISSLEIRTMEAKVFNLTSVYGCMHLSLAFENHFIDTLYRHIGIFTQLKCVYFLGELTKFGLCPAGTAMDTIQK